MASPPCVLSASAPSSPSFPARPPTGDCCPAAQTRTDNPSFLYPPSLPLLHLLPPFRRLPQPHLNELRGRKIPSSEHRPPQPPPPQRNTTSSAPSRGRCRWEVVWMYDPAGQIQVFKQAYYAMYGLHLEHDVDYQASGDHKKLLLAYVTTQRYEGPEVDRMMVEKDAKDLFRAGERRLGADEDTFIRIFSTRSRAHMAALSVTYHHMYGNSLKKAVKKETSGHFEFALLTIVRCALLSTSLSGYRRQ